MWIMLSQRTILMNQLHSYSTIFNVGHRAVMALLGVPCLVEEKVDGSQFSFGKINGEVIMRSKGAMVHAGDGGMFENASHIEADIDNMPEGLVFRCEYLQKPRHNIIKYDRVPAKYLI